MAKSKQKFICQNCEAVFYKWAGRCENCGEWNSLVEQTLPEMGRSAVARSINNGKPLQVNSLNSIPFEEGMKRLKTGIGDLDIILGGGILPGGVTLLAGQPGIGKSTLLLQTVANLGADKSSNLNFAASTSADDIAATIRTGKYQLVVVDSVQTLHLNEITSSPGSVSQITNSSNAIINAAKETGTSVIFVGHVTKEGSIAGPKILEHLVDVVLQFEGDRYGGFKIVRAVKNRYGSTNEAAIFEMGEKGLRIVENPSAALLAERRDEDGSVVLATLEGARPLLVEIQALVNSTNFGYPKRTASGFDINRLNLLIAVLERRTKLKLSDKDIYINVVGGIKISDPAADLAICMAIASASAGRRLNYGTVVFGEVGLGGEVRSVTSIEKRITEAKKLGFTKALAPRTGKDDFIIGVDNVRSTLIEYLQK